jgi:hypothetical protein
MPVKIFYLRDRLEDYEIAALHQRGTATADTDSRKNIHADTPLGQDHALRQAFVQAKTTVACETISAESSLRTVDLGPR